MKKKDDEIESMQAKLIKLQNERHSLSQRIKGIQSGSARKSKKIARLSSPEDSASITTRGTSTVIEGINDRDIIILDEKKDTEYSAFKGKRYFGQDHQENFRVFKFLF